MIKVDQESSGASMEVRRGLRLVRPRTPNQLHAYVRAALGFDVPRAPMVAGHAAPFDYLCHAFFTDMETLTEDAPETATTEPGDGWILAKKRPFDLVESAANQSGDCVVWANRGGGKTQLAAVATLLDMLFKPGIQVRILGGSFEQSEKMFKYLKQMLERMELRDLVAGRLTGKGLELGNGSRVEVLSQSERSVRGQRVHKLRCDEVELFEADVWDAAQLVTRSGRCGDVFIRASVEALSTMHRCYGLMQRLVQETQAGKRRLFRWSLHDTLQICEPRRRCESCSLWEDCHGRAKVRRRGGNGFLHIHDAVQQKARVGLHVWRAEILCEVASRSLSVYPEFDPKIHVFDDLQMTEIGRRIAIQPKRSSPRSKDSGSSSDRLSLIGGLDFGFHSPNVLLVAAIDDEDVLWVIDELVERETTSQRFIDMAQGWLNETIERLGRPQPLVQDFNETFAMGANRNDFSGLTQSLLSRRSLAWIGADPAGHARNDHTGVSTISLWKQAGFTIRSRRLLLEAGVSTVRTRLRRADGSVGLRIHRRCQALIEAMTMYHYPSRGDGNIAEGAQPQKDGHDHAADALRYMITNLDRDIWGVDYRDY